MDLGGEDYGEEVVDVGLWVVDEGGKEGDWRGECLG